ncbi:MAG: transketolase [bacterium]
MNDQINNNELVNLSKEVRKDILKMVHASKASHVGSAFSTVEVLVVLYKLILKISPKSSTDKDRDRFLLSKGHACTALYAILAELGFYEKKLLDDYSKDGSIFMSHINSEVPGVEFSTGSLGHALPVGVGVALAAKKRKKAYKTYVLMSDGELNEGSNWEAFMMAAHLKLDNLVAIIDANKIQALGFTKDILSLEPIEDKLSSFGWDVIRTDGHNYEQIYSSLTSLTLESNGKPKVLIADTVKGKGVSFMEGELKWHYSSPNDEEYDLAVEELS